MQKVEINDLFDKVQLTWAAPKQPKVFTVPIERFKQIHYLKHQTKENLSEDLLPFHVFEAGFDDHRFESLYRTIYFQVESEGQRRFLRALSSDAEVVGTLTDEEKEMRRYLEGKMYQYSPKTGKKVAEEKQSLSPQDFIKLNDLKIGSDFLRDNESSEEVSQLKKGESTA